MHVHKTFSLSLETFEKDYIHAYASSGKISENKGVLAHIIFNYSFNISIALIFLISPQNLFSTKTVTVFFANLFLTAFVYAFNDVEDAADDYNILEKRRKEPCCKW